MRRYFFAIFGLLLMALTASGAKPDFAYPERVSVNALASYKNALKQGDELTALRQLMDYYLAQKAKGDRPAAEALGWMGERMDDFKSPVFKSLAQGFYTSAINGYYISHHQTASERLTALYPIPADVDLWSAAQFTHVIDSVFDASLKNFSALREVRIDAYPLIVSISRPDISLYPRMSDFIVCLRQDATLESPYIPSSAEADKYISLKPLGDEGVAELDLFALRIEGRDPLSGAVVLAAFERLNLACDIYGVDYSERQKLFGRFYDLLLSEDGRPLSESAGIVLTRPYFRTDTYASYLLEKKYVEVFPGSLFADAIRRDIADFECPSVSVRVPSVMQPGGEKTMRVAATNVHKCRIDFHRTSESAYIFGSRSGNSDYLSGAPVKTIDVELPEAQTGREVVKEVELSLPEAGIYLATLTFPGMKKERKPQTVIVYVSQFTTVALGFDDYRFLVADAMTGAAVDKADVFRKTYKGVSKAGSTDSDGYLRLTDPDGTYFAEKGNDKFAPGLSVNDYTYKPRPHTAFAAFTSLPLYHPGDTVEWGGVVYEVGAGGVSLPIAGHTDNYMFFTPDGIAVDTLRLTSDAFGRVSGAFATTASMLTGRYSIRTERRHVASVTVSDYKLPSFEVTLDNAQWTGDSLVLTGRATTYTGQPVADAALNLSLASRPAWWRGAVNSSVEINKIASTDASGKFSITVGLDRLPPESAYVVYAERVEVTSAAGETQTAQRTFMRRKGYRLKANVPANICLEGEPETIKVEVYTLLDSIVKSPVGCSLIQKDSVVKSFTLPDGLLRTTDLASCKSGTYTLRLCSASKDFPADTINRPIVIYRTTDRTTPCESEFLWMPRQTVNLKAAERTADVIFGLNSQATLRAFLTDSTGIIGRYEKSYEAGLHRLEVEVPATCSEATLHLIYIGGGDVVSSDLNFIRVNPRNEIKIIAESFRDRLKPGATEEWTFRVVDATGTGRSAAVIAGMYNSALEALARADWQFRPQTLRSNLWHFESYYAYPQSLWGRGETKYSSDFFSLKAPQFELYGQSFTISQRRYSLSMKSAASNGVMIRGTAESTDDAIEEESVHHEEIVLYEAKAEASADMASPAMAYDEGSATGGDEEPQDQAADEFSYRDAETPLALFRPCLTTDNEGRLELRFTVPDANARWAFRAVAFTDSLLTTSFAQDVIAAKPLMVKPNLPRYVRSGDRVEVATTVINASDSTQHVTLLTETFDLATGEILSSHSTRLSPETGESRVVTTTIDVPSGISALGYRVKASTPQFADGEQTLLPVLSSETPVVESVTFYINPDSTTFSLTLPEIPADASVSLSYCNNPSWYLITSLPALADEAPSTAPQAASQIFSACVASGILKSSPEIADALKDWSKDPDSEMLTSMLERNSELKQLLLQATPWTLSARNDTERMSRLSMLLSDKNISDVIRRSVDLLSRLADADGAFRWCEGSTTASFWATSATLETLGLLNSLGYLPEDGRLKHLISNALSYYDSTVKKDFARYPKSTFPDYMLTRQRLKTFAKGEGASAAMVYTTQHLISTWRKLPLRAKADAAIVLHGAGYRRVASQIIGSIAEFASHTPSRGAYFPTLDDTWNGALDKVGITADVILALNVVGGHDALAKELCQWLITEKITTDWQGSANGTFAVAAVMKTMPSVVATQPMPAISLGGKALALPEASSQVGEIEMVLTPAEASQQPLTISSHASVPSWGAVTWLYTDSMSRVKASGVEGLSVGKSYVVVDAEGKPRQTTRFEVGDRVRVNLTIVTDTDLDYVSIVDNRPASFEPVSQLPAAEYEQNLLYYRENRDASTRLFIENLPRGTYVLSYEMWANNAGEFADGLATLQSHYAPRFVAHSAGGRISVENQP